MAEVSFLPFAVNVMLNLSIRLLVIPGPVTVVTLRHRRVMMHEIRDLQIGLRVRDWVRVRLFNSSFQASHYHDTYPFHPMSYFLYLKPTWRTRALETSLVWISNIVLVLNLVLVVQSEGPYWCIQGQILIYTPQFDTALRNKGYNVRLGTRR